MKSIFVTGAASGIGRASAILFASRGYRVGCYDIDLDGARAVAEQIGATAAPDARPSYGRLDVRNEESWRAALDDFAGELDVLFNCAGILRMGWFEDIPPDECRQQLEINVMGVVLGIQTALPRLTRRAQAAGSACIVTMSSASAVYGQPEMAVYSASKFAVRALTEALDLELRRKNVRVCDVMPLYVDTPMVRDQSHRPATMDRLGVKLTADDVAEVVWRAVHGRGLHYYPQAQMALMARMTNLAPEMSRAVMAKLAKS